VIEFPQVLVCVSKTAGSTPRDAGAFMRVSGKTTQGSVGGGHLEFKAIREARRWLKKQSEISEISESSQVAEVPEVSERSEALARSQAIWVQRAALGPSLGQCCGGVVWLSYEYLRTEGDWERRRAYLEPARAPVILFGGGHVGQAIAQALSPLPFVLTWLDSRQGYADLSIDFPQEEIARAPSTSLVLIMSHSHAEDLEIVKNCLRRRQKEPSSLPFIGLIGSRTKWARFQHQLQAQGFTEEECRAVTCPIGLAGIPGKEPSVIAASVVAQLLGIARGPRTL
jgi:xanthine dehydrogenase accessory factor